MIAQLTGKLIKKSPTEIILETGGVAFLIFIPLSTFETLPNENSTVTILTHLIVREDSLTLFGFSTETEREMFRQLISISGIGPKIAQTILSGISSSDLQNFILNRNAAALTTIPGVGRKTAERIIIELSDKVAKINSTSEFKDDSSQFAIKEKAHQAMLKLGFNRQQVDKTLSEVLKEFKTENPKLEEILKIALKKITG
ncbi:MAG: Holliday junction branch migration protein RuvA [Bacteroidota bacterium]